MDSLDRSCSSLPPFQSAYFSKAKAVQLSQRLDLCSLAYANPTHAQWMGDREITKIALKFSANRHRCMGRADGGCDAAVDHRRDGEGFSFHMEKAIMSIHFAKFNLLQP